DCYDLVNLHGVSGPTRTHQAIWTTQLESPIRDFAGLVLDVDVKPDMRIRPFNLCNRARQFDGFSRVEFCREGMMRVYWSCSCKQTKTSNKHCQFSHRWTSRDCSVNHYGATQRKLAASSMLPCPE